MESYRYRCWDEGGNPREGVMDAISELQARQALRRRGWKIVEVRAIGRPGQSGPAGKTRSPALVDSQAEVISLSLRQRSLLFLKLSVLLQAGVTIVEALRSTGRGEVEPIARTCASLERSISQGQYLSAAMARLPGTFERSTISLVQLGEESGRLTAVVGRLADTLKERQQRRERLVSQLTYPIFLLLGVSGMLALLIGFLVPRVNQMLVGLDLEMPWLTRAVVSVFEPKRLLLLGSVAGLILLAGLAAWLSPAGPLLKRRLLFETPVLKETSLRALLGDFCRNLALLLEVGFDWNRALVLSRTGVESFDHDLESFRKGLSERDFAEAVSDCELFPPMLRGLMQVGYETNRLGRLLSLYADLCQQELERRIELLFRLLEPGLLLILGLVVAVVVTASFLPMIGLLDKL